MWGDLCENTLHSCGVLWLLIIVFSRVLRGHNHSHTLSLKRNDYAVVGNCVSLALMYGGSGPHFFSQSLTSYIFGEPISEMMIADVPDYDVQERIQKV